MINIVLYQPEIPPNTGNIIRLCANTNSRLHLIHPLGFKLEDKQLRRAGLDYREFADVLEYPSFEEFKKLTQFNRLWACSTKGKTCYTDATFEKNDAFLFGPETRGLPAEILNEFETEKVIRIPMVPQSRSINLSNSVAIILFEALRQFKFEF